MEFVNEISDQIIVDKKFTKLIDNYSKEELNVSKYQNYKWTQIKDEEIEFRKWLSKINTNDSDNQLVRI